MVSRERRALPLLVFLVTAFGLSILVDVYLYVEYASRGVQPSLVDSLLASFARMWSPAVGAIAGILLSGERPLKKLASYLGLRQRVIVSFLVAPLIGYAALGVYAAIAFPLGFFHVERVAKLVAEALSNQTGSQVPLEAGYAILVVQLASGYLAAIAINAVFALGEEIGWRGFLYQEYFSGEPSLKAVLGIGLVWGLWHAPLIVLLKHNYPTAGFYGALVFLAYTTSLTYPLLYFTSRAKSILPSASLHGSVNALWGLTIASSPKGVVGELLGGAGLLGVVAWSIVGLALYYWGKRRETG